MIPLVTSLLGVIGACLAMYWYREETLAPAPFGYACFAAIGFLCGWALVPLYFLLVVLTMLVTTVKALYER